MNGSRQRGLWINPHTRDVFVWMVMDGSVQNALEHKVENGTSVFIADKPIDSEYKPRTPEVKRPKAKPAPAPVEAPKSEAQQLEANLDDLDAVQVELETTEE